MELDKIKRYLDEKQVAEITRLSVTTLRNWRHQGKGPAYIKIGRAVRYPLPDLIEFLEQRRVAGKW